MLFNTSADLLEVTIKKSLYVFRVQCLSDLAQIQKTSTSGGGGNSASAPGGGQQYAQLAAAASAGERTKLKRDSAMFATSRSQEELDQETEKLLHEKDEEIKKMHRMLQQMQAKLDNK